MGMLYLAPMAGVTDWAFRTVCAGLGADITVTEMVSSRALVYQDKKSTALLRKNPGSPCGAQIFGNDPEVMAGQGTIGLEILRELPTVDMIVVPAGGGGLLSGVAACVKQVNPRVKVIGVQAEGADAIYRSFREKRYVSTETVSTIADGIAVKCPGDLTVELINRYVDDVVTVSDMEISEAIMLLLERTKQLVEPAGATPVAACLAGKLDVQGKKVVCVLSGGNIDVGFVHRIIEQGLVSRGRRLRFTTKLSDKPGALGHLLLHLSDGGANIISIEHDKLSPDLGPTDTLVHIACEVGGTAHGQALLASLKEQNYQIILD